MKNEVIETSSIDFTIESTFQPLKINLSQVGCILGKNVNRNNKFCALIRDNLIINSGCPV